MEDDLRTLLAAARADDPDAALAALTLLGPLRDRLDTTERLLIESARAGGASWATIATALALTSRQAAEQRFLRLTATGTDTDTARATRRRQQSVDTHHGSKIKAIRTAARTLLRRIEADDAWTKRFTRAELARSTLRMAADAPPGALFALTTTALADLPPPAELPETIADAATTLSQTLSHKDSTKD
ncbi:hypothetical protein [Asanoa iriomotensis]|uniref:DUF222 domain-containing protein n=1 Tax=Asanoa iriomotensis TaxID=234613 RepID=A0ABQ4BXX3_9ACTN|nr:hypothetical protein [Asanoa iriomotensis]GIF55016.1 hypothetical protein Air01nite_11110 [Asanoa iriomotensis]